MGNENFSEKVSVNINSSTLSNIDLLVDNGYYSNRSDFINQALRNLLQQQQSTLDRIIDKNSDTARKNANQWFVGIYNLDAATLEELLSQGGGGTIHGYGVFAIDEAIDTDKLFAAVSSICIKGKVLCSTEIKEHYGLR